MATKSHHLSKDDYFATENPMITYSSPPRKKVKQSSYASAPRPVRHRVVVSSHNDVLNEGYSSPISSRYKHRIGTSLYNDTEDTVFSSPLRSRKRKHLEQSPISPTFHSIANNNNFLSPNRSNTNQNGRVAATSSCDRYTPTHGNLHRYNIHSPTKRFVHNNDKDMTSLSNVIAPSPQKRRKLGQNYSGTNDDPSSLNHRLKQKLSQHTYNQVLQSELLGFAAEHSNIVNQVFNANNTRDDTERNDNISSIQMDINPADDNETDIDVQLDELHSNHHRNGDELAIFGSPSLPNRRMARRASNEDERRNEEPQRDGQHRQHVTHHPLCPCFHLQNEAVHRNDDPSANSDESHGSQSSQHATADNSDLCVCDSITSNVATNFLMSPQRTLRYNNNQENMMQDEHDEMAMTPIKPSSQCQLSGSRKSMRNIAKSPFKVLDAPRLTDDFYLNLVDWSGSCNILSVGLGECVYLWSAFTSKVTKLCDLTKLFEENIEMLESNDYQDGYDMVCSVGWSKNHESGLNHCSILSNTSIISPKKQQQSNPSSTDYLAVGSGSGYVFVFDTAKSKLARAPLQKHNHRVGVIAWRNNNILCSGSRDRSIMVRDIRINDNNSDIVQELTFHKQEVCGLKWSEDSLYLASGGNDNRLAIWDIRYVPKNNRFGQLSPTGSDHEDKHKPLCYGKHKAAVKAITWSPHDSGLLASGGGTADRCIKFWNINSFISASSTKLKASHHHNVRSGNQNGCSLLKPIQVIDTGSQVCNLLWSKNCNEIVSTHGYSLNQIVVWKYPTMDKIVTLTGHTYRVLYLAGSPDGQTVVTGAGDETLRLWNIFPPNSQNQNDDEGANFVPRSFSIPLHIR
eukprot:CAMPEP_0197034680 /NCGR_PEP_ID=MMETSP1384-20130603/12709_1 /TAXON_ID=29189 /ORGANISM="Ammonia sp." /LENGTH=852 /DNA_ID=CAMNT_0042464631 /DNA_START=211 /DNA_END=2769 /DNA_ORIENTATION=-